MSEFSIKWLQKVYFLMKPNIEIWINFITYQLNFKWSRTKTLKRDPRKINPRMLSDKNWPKNKRKISNKPLICLMLMVQELLISRNSKSLWEPLVLSPKKMKSKSWFQTSIPNKRTNKIQTPSITQNFCRSWQQKWTKKSQKNKLKEPFNYLQVMKKVWSHSKTWKELQWSWARQWPMTNLN